MLARFQLLRDRLNSSLFFVPMLYVLGGVVLGELALRLDANVDGVPDRLTATVDSARNVLSVVAGASLAFAGIAFSVSLLLISLASSQYSPRVVHGLFRDPFNKRIMGVVIGVFTYCLVVMRAVRGPLEDSGTPVAPSLSILLAVVLGIVSIMSIVAFISHSAHTMDVSRILHGVTTEAIDQIEQRWPERVDGRDHPVEGNVSADGFAITFDGHGWVQQIDADALLSALEPNSRMWLDTAPGRYAIPNIPICTISPRPSDEEGVARRVRNAVIIGETRTMQQDVTYGVRQLADVALKALSPGINDPTTAQDALFHLGTVVRELLARQPPPRLTTDDDDRSVLRLQDPTHEELVALAFDEVRLAASGQPTVLIYLLEILHLLSLSLSANPTAKAALIRQADLVLAVVDLAELPGADHDRVRQAHRRRFE